GSLFCPPSPPGANVARIDDNKPESTGPVESLEAGGAHLTLFALAPKGRRPIPALGARPAGRIARAVARSRSGSE
ncbi:MAG TPA: hypothetical protein VI072_29260, partial [Polyangiaceae bacterium]